MWPGNETCWHLSFLSLIHSCSCWTFSKARWMSEACTVGVASPVEGLLGLMLGMRGEEKGVVIFLHTAT